MTIYSKIWGHDPLAPPWLSLCTLAPSLRPCLAGAFSLWCRKGKAFCEHAFALHRQQHGKDKQNIDYAPPGKVFVDAHAPDLNFFQISGMFPTCFGCFLPANATNKKSIFKL